MRPKSLYYTLGMDKKTYSEAPEIYREPIIQGEHYYVKVTGEKQKKVMIDVLNRAWTRRNLDVKANLRDKDISYYRIDMFEMHTEGREMKVQVTSKRIIDANSGDIITIRDFVRDII